jgi:hypothetical protein
MPRRKITFDVAINTPSAQREAQRLASIFQSRLNNIQVGTGAGRGGGGGGGGGGGKSGGSFGPFGDKNAGEWLRNTAGFAVSGMFYKFFSDLPKNIAELERGGKLHHTGGRRWQSQRHDRSLYPRLRQHGRSCHSHSRSHALI